MSEGTTGEITESQINRRISGKKSGEYGLKAVHRAPQFPKH